MLAHFDYLSLAGPSMAVYWQKEKDVYSKYQFIDPLPFALFEGVPEIQRSQKPALEIVIPGTLRGEGRDYQKVRAAFEHLAPGLQRPVKLIFLGGTKGNYAQKIIRDFQAIENDFFRIQYSPKFISQKEFDRQLRRADFLILPLKKDYQLGIIREIYGTTNISGGINDMIRFGIPTLITPDYPLESELSALVRRFDSAESLADLLKEWITRETYKKIREQAPELLEAYRIEKRAAEVELALKQVLSQ